MQSCNFVLQISKLKKKKEKYYIHSSGSIFSSPRWRSWHLPWWRMQLNSIPFHYCIVLHYRSIIQFIHSLVMDTGSSFLLPVQLWAFLYMSPGTQVQDFLQGRGLPILACTQSPEELVKWPHPQVWFSRSRVRPKIHKQGSHEILETQVRSTALG